MPSSRTSSGVFVRRCSVTATSDKPFERPLSSVPSLASHPSRSSIRTRLTSVSRSDYHDDLKVSLDSKVTRNLAFATFIIAFGSSFQFGWNIGVLNNPSQLIKDFLNETYSDRFGEQISPGTVTLMWSLTTALFIPGGMAGAFLGGVIADKLGRKKSILLSHLFVLAGAAVSCACVAAKAPELLMLGRVLFGVNSGLGNCLAPMFLTEISPFNLRGALGTIHQLAVTLGIFFSSVFGLKQILGTAEGWPFLLLMEIIPTLTSLIIMPLLPESPRYLLLTRGEREQAEKSLRFYRMTDDVTTDMEEMDTESQQQKALQEVNPEQDKKEVFTFSQFLRQRELFMPLMIACILQVIQQLSGINAIFFFSSGIFENAGVPLDQVPFAVIGTNLVNVAMTIVSVRVMDVAGRRILLIIPMAVMTVDLLVLTLSLNLQYKLFWMNYISVICIIVYVIGFAVGLGPIPMMIGSELFRQGPRPMAMACAGVTNWVFTFIIAMTFESVQEKLDNFTFVVFLVLMFIFLLFIYFFVPETKGKTFEEIAHEFSPGDDLEVEMVEEDVFDDIPEHEETANEETRLVTVNFRLGSEDETTDPKSDASDVLHSESKDGIKLTELPKDDVPVKEGKIDETKHESNDTKA